MASKSVLITGAAGFIGSHLAEACLARDWHVIGVDAFTDYYSPDIKRANVERARDQAGFTLVEGDLLELDLRALLDGVSVVFHLAAQPGVRASWDQFDVYAKLNLTATQRLLEAARGQGLERFVVASSSSIYGDAEELPTPEDALPLPVSPYGVTKLSCEHLARVYWRSFDVPTVSLRYFTVYGPRQRPDMAFNRLISAALAGQSFRVFGDGSQTRDFTYVADTVSGTIAASEHGAVGSVYNLGGGSRRSMNDVFRTLEQLLDAPIKREYLARQSGDARDTSADIARAKRDLGYEPAYSFEAGLAEQLNWQRVKLAGPSGIGR